MSLGGTCHQIFPQFYHTDLDFNIIILQFSFLSFHTNRSAKVAVFMRLFFLFLVSMSTNHFGKGRSVLFWDQWTTTRNRPSSNDGHS